MVGHGMRSTARLSRSTRHRDSLPWHELTIGPASDVRCGDAPAHRTRQRETPIAPFFRPFTWPAFSHVDRFFHVLAQNRTNARPIRNVSIPPNTGSTRLNPMETSSRSGPKRILRDHTMSCQGNLPRGNASCRLCDHPNGRARSGLPPVVESVAFKIGMEWQKKWRHFAWYSRYAVLRFRGHRGTWSARSGFIRKDSFTAFKPLPPWLRHSLEFFRPREKLDQTLAQRR